MGSDSWLGVEPLRDANGKAIPLDTEILYTTSGQVFQVGQFRYSVRANRWFVYGHYEHQRKSWIDITSCFLLTPPDSWEFEGEYDDAYECPECGKKFILEVHTEITYTSKRRIEDMPEGWRGDD